MDFIDLKLARRHAGIRMELIKIYLQQSIWVSNLFRSFFMRYIDIIICILDKIENLVAKTFLYLRHISTRIADLNKLDEVDLHEGVALAVLEY